MCPSVSPSSPSTTPPATPPPINSVAHSTLLRAACQSPSPSSFSILSSSPSTTPPGTPPATPPPINSVAHPTPLLAAFPDSLLSPFSSPLQCHSTLMPAPHSQPITPKSFWELRKQNDTIFERFSESAFHSTDRKNELNQQILEFYACMLSKAKP